MGLVGTSVAHHSSVLVGTLLSSFLRACGGRLGETMMELCRHVDVERCPYSQPREVCSDSSLFTLLKYGFWGAHYYETLNQFLSVKQSYHTPKIVTLTIITDDDDMSLKSDLPSSTLRQLSSNVSLFLRRRGSLTFCGFQTAKKSG